MNKSTPLPSGKMSALEKYSEIYYNLDKSNNIEQATILANGYKVLEEPAVYLYYHDNKPNPIQNMFVERWYQFDLENGGLTNVTRRRYRGRILEDRVYEYNELGYPTQYVINESRTKTFTYAQVAVPVQEEPTQALAAATDSLEKTPSKEVRRNNRKLDLEAKPFVLLCPNPASINFTVRANNLGQGEAVLRIFDYFTMRVLTQVQYQVDGQLEALITTNGMPAGLYIVELSSPSGKIRQRLLVQ
ncbi:T9SS type A sorting domain-containing protein [Rufibacter radiotolerans]